MPTTHKTRSHRLVEAGLLCLLAMALPAAAQSGETSAAPIRCGINISVNEAVVVTADSIASAVGHRVLFEGGNAVDASIAVAFALAVTLPRAGNIGGGGFMMVRRPSGEVGFIDYREKAPSRARSDMYLDAGGEVVADLSTDGHLAVGVPGTVRGLALAHEMYGSLPWRRLVEPSVRLARDGFVVSSSLAQSLEGSRTLLGKFGAARRVFVEPALAPGDRLVQADLANTLERIAGDWKDFYEGETARKIVAEMERHGGLITAEDLSAYEAVVREPLQFDYHGHRVIAAPLPSSGGVILSQLFQMLANVGVSAHERQSSRYVHLVCEAEKIAYRERALYLGDEDFYASPWREMVDPDNVLRLSKWIDPEGVLKVKVLDSKSRIPESGDQERQPSEQTTHFSIVDRWGNAVANTYTLNGSYGSGVVVEGAGFLLNNEMDDFSIKPGYPNLYGLVGSEANAIEPGKRMLSSMSPTLVTKAGKLVLVLGTPGGSTIPTTVLQVILNVVDHGMTLFDAVATGRFHEQYLPDRVYAENGALDSGTIDGLLSLGHRIEIRKPIGNVQAIQVKDGKLVGVSDPRGDGRAIGH